MECFKNDKRISGVKISNFDMGREYSDVELFCMAKNISAPNCKICGSVVSLNKKREFTTFCGMECQKIHMSNNNKIKNVFLNKNKSKVLFENNKEIFKQAHEEYIKDGFSTLETLSKKYNISKYSLRIYIKENGEIDHNRNKRVRYSNIDKKLNSVKSILSDKEYIRKNIENKNNLTDISKQLGCSKNYAAKYLRDMGTPYPKLNVSSEEKFIHNLLEDLNVNFIKNDRSLLNGLELDVLIPDKKVAIEINGSYWHQCKDGFKDKNYHKNKTVMSEEKGFRLIHINDIDIKTKPEMVKSLIKNSLGLSKKIYARHCVVKEISSSEYRDFCKNNHMSNSSNASIRLGLFFEDELVSVIGFGSPRFNKKYDYELIRFCTKIDYVVIGGASKLFRHFINNKESVSIISYCNRKFFSGDVYTKIGMTHLRDTPPNYVWVNLKINDIKTRYMCQKHLLNTKNTENVEMLSRGYYKVYDSGNKVFEFIKEK